MTYELSLLDSTGHLRRVDYSPTIARERNEQVVDVTHEGIRNIPSTDPYPTIFPPEWKDGWKWWVASLKPGAEKSAALKSVEDLRATPYLTIRVNGVRIAARGGSWGMDDSRKRVSREKLEPYFRLHQDANVNIIRNWVGQSTEEVFFDLADEYGLLVWNDFWASTQSYNVEPEDPQLFLDNARDTILRYRNHPSIAIWCGRNEGVPQPTLNEGLDQLIRTLDGTRYYTPTSNQVNLQNSGPYRYVDPKLYFSMLNHGFSVETGTLSFPTVETWKAWIPEPDRWPISDVWAYHDWHADGNGASAPFMDELQREFGAATSLEDFGRKAQMLNYVQHRAIFEGMNAHLWAPNTGRMLWMTQPAWPSSNWQILSSDYDTQASFYGVKKASEMLHVQLDPTTYQVQIINSFPTTTPILRVYAKIFSLDSKLLAEHQVTKDAPSGATDAFPLDLAPLLKKNMVLIKLELSDASGKLISDNFYWLGGESADYRRLNRLPQARLSATANETSDNGNVRVQVHIENTGTTVSLETKLTLMNASGVSRVLPAYYSDNYLCLLPGESREIVIESPASAATNGLSLALRAWNYSEEHLEVVRGGAKQMAAEIERHKADRVGWLRAAVLGANDGILSTASLVLGVAASHAQHKEILIAGIAGLVAGGMSMAAGEYVSVHSQADTEQADLNIEKQELKRDSVGEQKELSDIYISRGLEPSLAKQVAKQLMAHDALGAHARDELGISEHTQARPIQAAFSSAASFVAGASTSSRCYGGCTAIRIDPFRGNRFAAVPRGIGRSGGPCGRGQGSRWCDPRHVLGRPGNGRNCRHWRAFWHHGLDQLKRCSVHHNPYG